MANGENLDPISLMDSQEKLRSVDDSLSQIKSILENAVSSMQTAGSGMTTGLSELRKDIGSSLAGLANVGASIAPMTHTDMAMATQPHHGMFLHSQGVMAAMAGTIAPSHFTPQGIDPYSYQQLSRKNLGSITEATAVGAIGGAAEMGTSIAFGAGAMKVGAAAGTFLGGPVGAFIGGAAGLAAGFAFDAASEAVGPVARWRERREIKNIMDQSSWRITGTQWGAGSLGGMSEGQSEAVATGIQKLSDVSSFSRDEVRTIVQHGMARGMYDESRSVGDVIATTRDIMRDVKAVSNRAHVPIESAIGVMANLKEMGFGGNPAAAIAQFDTLGMASGRTAMEMMSFAGQGAEMFRGTGMSMATGAMGAAQMLQQVRGMQMAGIYSPETVRQLGGPEAMAMTQLQKTQQFMMTDPMFRGMGMAMVGQGTVGTLNPAQVASTMLSSPQEMIQQAYSSQEGGFTGFANKALNFQMNQDKFVEQIGATGVQKMQDVAIMKQVQFATKILPGAMTDTAEKREALMFDIARKQGMSHPEARAFVDRIGNMDAALSGHDRAMAIQGRKLAAEEEAANTRWKTFKRDVGRGVSDTYDWFSGISGPDTKFGRMFSAIGTGLHNLMVAEEDQIINADFDAADVDSRNMEVRNDLLDPNTRKRVLQPLKSAIDRASDRKKKGKFTSADLEGFAGNELKMRQIRGGKSREEVEGAVAVAMAGKDGFSAQSFVDEMGWKDKDGKPLKVGDNYENLTPDQKKFLAVTLKKNINKDDNPKSFQKAQVEMGKLGLDDDKMTIQSIVQKEAELTEEIKGNKWKFWDTGVEGDVKDLAEELLPGVVDSKLEDAIEKDDSSELTLALAGFLEKGGEKQRANLVKIMKAKGLKADEVSESFSMLSGLDDTRVKGFVDKARDLATKKSERLTQRIVRDVASGAISEKEAASIYGDLSKGEFRSAEKKLGIISAEEEGVSMRQVSKTAEVSKMSQNEFNQEMLNVLIMIKDSLQK